MVFTTQLLKQGEEKLLISKISIQNMKRNVQCLKNKKKKRKNPRIFHEKYRCTYGHPGFIAKTGAIISRKVYSLASFAGDH